MEGYLPPFVILQPSLPSLVLPTAEYFDDFGDVTVWLTFPQAMDTGSVPQASSFYLDGTGIMNNTPNAQVWNSPTELEQSYNMQGVVSGDLTLDYTPALNPLTTAVGARQYDAWVDLNVPPQ